MAGIVEIEKWNEDEEEENIFECARHDVLGSLTNNNRTKELWISYDMAKVSAVLLVYQ